MVPLTASRVHFLEKIVGRLVDLVLLGLYAGVFWYACGGEISRYTLFGVTYLVFIFNALASNLRHSHVWLSFGPRLEHILNSPAQHQIHHSDAPRHFHKNFGTNLSIWDWMFGTLYVPVGYEELRFGVADAQGREIEQPYTTLKGALVKPFAESYSAMRGKPAESTQAGALPPTPTKPAE